MESDPHETRIAILEQDRLTELFVERHHQLGIVGNIYKGRVHRVLPGMQAAFVDIGLARDAFLYVSEVVDPSEESVRFDDADDASATDGPSAEPIESRRMEFQRVDPDRPSIDQLLKPGQEVVVQVLKDAMPNKGARVSTQITLPGRSLVLLPHVHHLGVSRRIEGEEERAKIRALLEAIQPEGVGLIARTVGADASRDDLQADLRYLERLWDRIRRRAETVSAPTLIHRDLDLALRVVRDYLSDEVSVVWVDGEETYERLVEFIDQIQPDLLGRVKLHQQDNGLFERFELDQEIDRALDTKVWLKSGGHIVIHPTEALVA
ncbi:MAG: ribonuclease E/G, partial [Acidobacteriota bacterium]